MLNQYGRNAVLSTMAYDGQAVGPASIWIVKLLTVVIVIIVFCPSIHKANRGESIQNVLAKRIAHFIKGRIPGAISWDPYLSPSATASINVKTDEQVCLIIPCNICAFLEINTRVRRTRWRDVRVTGHDYFHIRILLKRRPAVLCNF